MFNTLNLNIFHYHIVLNFTELTLKPAVLMNPTLRSIYILLSNVKWLKTLISSNSHTLMTIADDSLITNKNESYNDESSY